MRKNFRKTIEVPLYQPKTTNNNLKRSVCKNSVSLNCIELESQIESENDLIESNDENTVINNNTKKQKITHKENFIDYNKPRLTINVISTPKSSNNSDFWGSVDKKNQNNSLTDCDELNYEIDDTEDFNVNKKRYCRQKLSVSYDNIQNKSTLSLLALSSSSLLNSKTLETTISNKENIEFQNSELILENLIEDDDNLQKNSTNQTENIITPTNSISNTFLYSSQSIKYDEKETDDYNELMKSAFKEENLLSKNPKETHKVGGYVQKLLNTLKIHNMKKNCIQLNDDSNYMQKGIIHNIEHFFGCVIIEISLCDNEKITLIKNLNEVFGEKFHVGDSISFSLKTDQIYNINENKIIVQVHKIKKLHN